MPATIAQVAAGLKTRLATVSGLRVFDYTPDQVNPPVAFPVLNTVNYHTLFGDDGVEMSWSVHVVVGRYVDRVSFTNLDAYLSYSGATSIRAALEGDLTLGGIVDTMIVEGATQIESVSVAEAEFLQIRFDLKVYS